MKKNRRLGGFSTRIIKSIFTRMQVNTFKIDVYPWKRAITMIKKGNADALFSANLTKERTVFAFYPDEPIVKSPWVMWARDGEDLKFSSFNDLLGKKIGVVRGYSYTPEFWQFVKEHCTYDEVTTDKMNFMKLNARRVDLIPAELGNGLHIVKTLKLDKIIPLTNNPVKTDGLYIIFNKKNVSRAYVNQFSNELKKFKNTPLYQYLYREYFGF